MALALWVASGYGEMYRWVDERGTVHFVDDLSRIPEKYRPDAETRTHPKETPASGIKERPTPPPLPSVPKTEGVKGYEVKLLRRSELFLAEVILNRRVKRYLVVDTGASFTLIDRPTAKELGLTVDGDTPFLWITSVTDTVSVPLATLGSVQVGEAEVENVEVLIYNMPSGGAAGLLGNSFLNKYRVVLDSIQEKMTLFPMQGELSPDRPGGYSRDYWVGQFRFYHRVLGDLKVLKTKQEGRSSPSELKRVSNAIRYFEDKLSELDRRASFAGVPRNWRE